MLRKYAIVGRPASEAIRSVLEYNQPDFVVGRPVDGFDHLEGPDNAGSLRMIALRHFVKESENGDHCLIMDDDDYADIKEMPNGEYTWFAPNAQDRPPAVWAFAISYNDAVAICQRMEGVDFNFHECEDQLLVGILLGARHKTVDFVKYKEVAMDRSYRISRADEDPTKFYKIVSLLRWYEIEQMFQNCHWGPAMAKDVRRWHAKPDEVIRLFSELQNMEIGQNPTVTQEFRSEAKNFVLDLLAKCDCNLILPGNVLRGVETPELTSNRLRKPVYLFKVFCPKDEQWLKLSMLNENLFRIKYPAYSCAVKVVYVWNGPGKREWADLSFADIPLSKVRENCVDTITEDCLVAWCDGDDTCDISVLVENGAPSLLTFAVSNGRDNRSPCASRSVLAYDGIGANLTCHWNTLLDYKDSILTQRRITQRVKDGTDGRADGIFYWEDVMFMQERPNNLVVKSLRPFVYRNSSCSANGETKYTFERWMKLFGTSLQVMKYEGFQTDVDWYYGTRIKASMVDDEKSFLELKKYLSSAPEPAVVSQKNAIQNYIPNLDWVRRGVPDHDWTW